MRSLHLALLGSSILIMLSACPAWAGDTVSAEAVFQAGREAAVRGDYREACAKFAESQRLDPAPGTLINLGDCKEHLGLFASAWGYYREAADRLTGDERVEGLKARVAAIEPRLSRHTLAPGAPDEARITRDGVELGAASLGVAMPIDPGEHVVVVTAPGREPRRYVVSIGEAESPALALEPGATAVAITPPPPPPPPPPPRTPPRSGRAVGFVIGSLGVASMAASGVTGVMTIQRKATVKTECPGQVCRSSAGLDAAAQDKTLSLVSTVTFATGLVGLGVGAYLVLSGGSKSTPAVALTTTITPDTTGLRLVGQF